MVREELLHPVSVHFPIVLFILSLMLKLVLLAPKNLIASYIKEINFTYRLCLFSAPIFYMITIFLGDLSLEAAKPTICNFTLAHQHEEMAESMIPLFIIAILLEVFLIAKPSLRVVHIRITNFFIVSSLILCNYTMVQTAHLGGQLVYDYGTGVKDHSCPKD